MSMKKIYRNVCVAVIVLMAVPVLAQAQRLVTGTIRDASGEGMPGVNVLIRGTTNGTASDAGGDFSIQASDDDVLVISFIGYETQEVSVGTRTSIEVVLSEDLTTLGEVVVVGYGVQKKVLNTGANLQVKGDDISKQSTTNALQA